MNRRSLGLGLLGLGAVMPAAAIVPSAARVPRVQYGLASYYCCWFHGRTAADGRPFNEHALTAAHRTLPLGTRVRVTNLATGQRAVLTITDRGPYADARHRILDVSRGAAIALGGVRAGVFPVELVVLL